MASLTDLPELVGFFSYSREDDADSHGALSALRNRIQGELRGQLGRTAKTFRLWQDKEAIPSGTLWETEIKNAVGQAVFFIPIITPTVVVSPYCSFELESFLTREAELGRADLVFPILYVDVPELQDAAQRQKHPVLSLIAKRQYRDWCEFRYLDVNTPEVKREVARFCTDVRNALRRSWLSPQERGQQEEASARQQAEVERGRQEAEAKRRAEEEAQQIEEETARRKRETEAEQKRAHAERQKAERERLRAEAEAKHRAEAEEHHGAPAPRPWWQRPALIVGAIVGVMVVLGAIGAWFVAPPAPAPVTPTPGPPIDTSLCKDQLCGTTWSYSDSTNEKCDLIFKPNNEVVKCGTAGPYSTQSNDVRFSFNNKFAQYQGTINGTRISGAAKNTNNFTWTWSAIKK